MKLAVWFCLAWAALLPVAAHGSLGKPEHLSISGADHVRLEDWARAKNFQIKWVVPKQELKLSRTSATLGFTTDSARVSLNGVQVWLSAPIAFRNGSAWIASVDLTTALEPVLSPAKSSASRTISRIVLDPGHGGKDPGFHDGKQLEKKYTLLLAKDLGELLNKAGFKASLTRTGDSFLDLPLRPDLARRRNADLFISLHFNSFSSAEGSGGSAVKGAETYSMTPAHTSSTNSRGEGAGTGAYPGNRADARNILLAYQIQKALLKIPGVEDRGLRRARYAVLRSAEMPAVLIEGGFMSNPSDAKRIFDPASRRQMAQAIVDGIKAFKNLVEP